jgi:hypothetical protein
VAKAANAHDSNVIRVFVIVCIDFLPAVGDGVLWVQS